MTTKININSRWSTRILHLLVWLGLAIFPILWPISDSSFQTKVIIHIWAMLITLAITFYTNYFWLFDKFFSNKRIWFFILLNLSLFVLLYCIRELIFNQIEPERPRPSSTSIKGIFMYGELIMYSLGVGLAIAVRNAERLMQSEMERKRLETEKLTSEISLLKYQMQPHFFFNTLNNIYVLISKSPQEAQKSVHSLSKMMRYILYENSSELISLNSEIDFLRNYDNLMKIRMNDSVDTSFSAPENCDGINIPPLLLIPLLENAYKHGVSPDKKSFINSHITIDNGRLRFEVHNSLPAVKSDDRSDSGIGLANLKKRLEILYKINYIFISQSIKDEYIAVIDIPI